MSGAVASEAQREAMRRNNEAVLDERGERAGRELERRIRPRPCRCPVPLVLGSMAGRGVCSRCGRPLPRRR